MTDIYDDAIQATLKYGNIKRAWVEGGNGDGIPLHGLLFRSCPNLGGLCLTECKSDMCTVTKVHEYAKTLIDALKLDDLIPSSQHALECQWDNNTEEQRTIMLERFAMYNRELDELFDREPADLKEED